MNNEEVAVAVGAGLGLITMLIGLVVFILFLLTLHRCLDTVRPENRAMQPAMVWLNLIPLFNLVWIFVTVIRMADSVTREAAARGLDFGDGAKGIGIAYAALMIATIIPVLGMITGLVGLVLFIIYWVKVAGFRRDLKTAAEPPPAA